jgi:hypothetical protein
MSCGAPHPNYGAQVLCEEATSEPNATTDPVYKMVMLGTGPSPELDEDGHPIVLEEGHPVHVHKGYLRDGEDQVLEVCRWEDPPTE